MAKQATRYAGDGLTAAESAYDEGSVPDGSSTAPRRIWWRNASTAGETFAGCQLTIGPVGQNDGDDYLQIASDVPVAAPGQCAAALHAGTALEIGSYEYAVTFATANGETLPGARRAVTTTSGNQRVDLSGIPIGPSGVTARRLYRTAVGGGDLLLVAELADNVTTTYLDEVPDAGLGAEAPTLNTSGCPGTWGTSTISLGDLTAGAWAAGWMRFSIPSGTSQVGNPRRACVTFQETGA
jgi:hypothetical protein